MLEEERRLFYVGITRAETKLLISHAEQRRRNGETMPSMRSSFLARSRRHWCDDRATMKLARQRACRRERQPAAGAPSATAAGVRRRRVERPRRRDAARRHRRTRRRTTRRRRFVNGGAREAREVRQRDDRRADRRRDGDRR